ncbi:ATP-binding protein [Melioribacter sp. OK-6-Me]|uniref:sensor histidine kinase n=1 Tax=unclassified Melioribacter TaxID=2627329 RepID=UPI003ED8AFA0
MISISILNIAAGLLLFDSDIALILVIFFVVAGVLGLARAVRIKTINELSRELEKTVQEKTAEIMNLNSKLEILNSAIDAEKEYFRVILGSIENGVIALDLKGKVFLVNKSAENILGIEEKDIKNFQLVSLFESILEENYRAKSKYFDMSDIENFIPMKNEQLVINAKDRKRKILQINSLEIKDEKELRGVVFILKDKTESIAVENQLAVSQKMESIGQLAAGIAHEINTPLQYISDNINFLEHAFFNIMEYLSFINEAFDKLVPLEEIIKTAREKEKEYDFEFLKEEIPNALDQSHTGIRRVNRIVLSMKEFAHPGTNEMSHYDLNHSIEVVTNITRNKWKYIADLELELDPKLPNVYCNLDQINQVVLNMILNSADAIEEKIKAGLYKKGTIRIKTAKKENNVEIIIWDNGIGIKEEYLHRVFDPFFTTKEVGKGTGQGLSICHNIIVNKHKGSILINSRYKEGTKFIIKLPSSEGAY